MKANSKTYFISISAVVAFLIPGYASANTGLHTSWLWHLHQPVYWPDHEVGNDNHYQNAWDTMQLQDGGFGHPVEHMRDVFSLNDRVHAYQEGPKNTLQTIGWSLNSGVQLNYSGALMEDIQSLASANQYYGNNTWYTYNQQARTWTTTGGKPRMDLTNFTYHHALAPFISDETLEMEIRIHQRHQQILWNSSSQVSRGFFPAETCFSERLIPVLNKVGIAWSVIANNHLTRSCADFPLVIGSGGETCDLPNKADQINPAQGAGNYKRLSIDRGCSPSAAMPFAFQLHYARYVNPSNGVASTMIVVPSDQALGWKDSYSTWDVGLMGDLNARNNPSKPSFVLLAHDGDNAWSGGNSYYNEWVPNFTTQVNGLGYEPTTVEQYLSEFPPAAGDVVHVEDGGWVYAADDCGSPIMINWHWPPSYTTNVAPYNIVDPSQGVSDKADAWRVIIATENRVKTAQQIQNTLTGYTNRIDQIRDPGSYSGTPSAVELGWHYYLGGLDSGFVYFGCHDDECWRQTLAQSNACRNVDSILTGNPTFDTTPPTVFIPQRHPWNPGTTNYGVQYKYNVYVPTNSDFWVWTYAYDASGITNVTLYVRSNGNAYPPTQDQFKTYAGGTNTGAWVTSPMVQRPVAALNAVLPPKYIADYYYAKITGLSDTYADYYVSATDSRGNTYNSPIQHVYVAPNPGGPPPPPTPPPVPANVTDTPVTTNQINVAWSPASGATAYLIQRGGTLIATLSATSFADTNLNANTQYCYAVAATNSAGGSLFSAPVCTNTLALPPPPPAQPFVLTGTSTNYPNYLLGTANMRIYAAIRGTQLYVATWSPGTNGPNDHFIFVTDQLLASASALSPWGKVGLVAVAPTKPFLGGDSVGSYVGWQGTTATSQAIKAPTNADQMQGTIDLVQAFGYLPATIYLSAAAYSTTNGGYLVSQGPAGNGDLNIDPPEFLALPTASITDSAGNGTFDYLDPARALAVRSVLPATNGFTVTWPAVPGKSYQVLRGDSLGAAWSSNGIPSVTAASGQGLLTYTDTSAGGATQRFYKVKLLP